MRPISCRSVTLDPAQCALRCRTAAWSQSAVVSLYCHRIRNALKVGMRIQVSLTMSPLVASSEAKCWYRPVPEARQLSVSVCHGPTLKGIAEIPAIAGRAPIYLFRQLNDIQTDNRHGGNVPLMKAVVANLTQGDMIAIAAYLGSLEP